jgi:ATP-dependent Lon protease
MERMHMMEFLPRLQEMLTGDRKGRDAEGETGSGAGESLRPLPDDAMIVIPMRNAVLFPGVLSPVSVGRASSVSAAEHALREELPVGFLLQRDAALTDVSPDDLHWVGTAGRIARHIAAPEGVHHLVVQGQGRFRVLQFLEGWPFMVARVAPVDAVEADGPEIEARFLQLREQAAEAIDLLPNAPQELKAVIQGMDTPGLLADMVANIIDAKREEKQDILETFDVKRRLDKVLALLGARVEVLRLSREIGEKTRKEFDERQREHVLREQLRQIRKELGDDADTAAELEELRSAIDAAGMPDETREHARKELRRLERMNENSAESSMLRTYLDWLVELPWKADDAPGIDIGQARSVLHEDHFGLEKIKRRILEHLAVRKLNPQGRSPILCFAGPPGVGKTSLGQSIARAIGRPFQRVALGGVHDEAEIRGHRRTYIGAMPGNIVQALKRAGSRNAVLMLDEIDKLGAGGFHGDPSSALLEVLDPEQNARFRDNYLGVDFDLSRILFIATANQLDTIPGPLRDRMEVIPLSGYTEEEKLEIVRRHLLARQQEANGLGVDQTEVTPAALRAIVAGYTREAGVRNLERELGSVLRHAAMRIAEGESGPVVVDAGDLPAILGPRRFDNEVAGRTPIAGVATGLAWTPVGGDILFIEAAKVPGTGRLTLTGQLGEVMKESAQAAMTLARTHLGEKLDTWDIHIHVPAGATPKDGPSAGVAMFLALVSAITGRAVRPEVAMTGEISLRGLVLPIGGVKEKTLAALRAGIRTVMLPKRNEKDLADVPAEVREGLEFVLLDRVEDALAVAFAAAPETAPEGETAGA